MNITLQVLRGKADVGDLSEAQIVVLNDDSFPMNVQDDEDELEMVKGFMLHCYHTLKSE